MYASLSLPFCPPVDWERTWRALRRSVGAGGWFAATLFGPRDAWADRPEMTFPTPGEVRARLDGFHIKHLTEWEGETRLALGGTHHTSFR